MDFNFDDPATHKEILAHTEANPADIPALLTGLREALARMEAEAAQLDGEAARLAAAADRITAYLEAAEVAA